MAGSARATFSVPALSGAGGGGPSVLKRAFKATSRSWAVVEGVPLSKE